jgi:hypothetical protein
MFLCYVAPERSDVVEVDREIVMKAKELMAATSHGFHS